MDDLFCMVVILFLFFDWCVDVDIILFYNQIDWCGWCGDEFVNVSIDVLCDVIDQWGLYLWFCYVMKSMVDVLECV